MTTKSWLSRQTDELPNRSRLSRIAGGVGTAVLLLTTGVAAAQSATPAAPAASAPAASAPSAPEQVVENGYVIRQTADLGGHVVSVSGSGAMYNTLVNIHSGPRVLGQTFTMDAMPGTKHAALWN